NIVRKLVCACDRGADATFDDDILFRQRAVNFDPRTLVPELDKSCMSVDSRHDGSVDVIEWRVDEDATLRNPGVADPGRRHANETASHRAVPVAGQDNLIPRETMDRKPYHAGLTVQLDSVRTVPRDGAVELNQGRAGVARLGGSVDKDLIGERRQR